MLLIPKGRRTAFVFTLTGVTLLCAKRMPERIDNDPVSPLDGDEGHVPVEDSDFEDEGDDGILEKSYSVFDHRGNSVRAVQQETLWAARVLAAAKYPNMQLSASWVQQNWRPGVNSSMDLFWATVRAMLPPPKISRVPSCVDILGSCFGHSAGVVTTRPRLFLKPQPSDELLVVSQRNTQPQRLIQTVQRSGFKDALDVYMVALRNKRAELRGPTCSALPIGEREEVRGDPMFKQRGRVDKAKDLSRQDSLRNMHAGIATIEKLPAEVIDFWNEAVTHAKSKVERSQSAGDTDAKFLDAGAPFIAGASGTIQYLIQAMESTDGNRKRLGEVPCGSSDLNGETNPDPHLREAILGLWTAMFIALGHHSLTECLMVAQRMGYFITLPDPLSDYHKTAAEFEVYLDEKLGIGGSKGILSDHGSGSDKHRSRAEGILSKRNRGSPAQKAWLRLTSRTAGGPAMNNAAVHG